MSVPLAYSRTYLVWRRTPIPPEDRTGARVSLDRLHTDLVGLAGRVESGRDLDYRTLANHGFEELRAVEQAVEREVPESGRAVYDTYLAATRSWLREFARLGAFEDRAPPLRESVLWGVTCIALEVALLRPPVDLEQAVWAALVAMFGIGAWSAVFCRGSWVYAITIDEDGFLFRGPFRRPRFVHWTSITEVVASALHDGTGESAITLHIWSAEGRAWVPQHLMPFYAIVEQLKRLEGFDRDAWSSADVPEDDMLRSVIPKRTVVYRARPSSVAV